MKKLVLAVAVLSLILLFAACGENTTPYTPAQPPVNNAQPSGNNSQPSGTTAKNDSETEFTLPIQDDSVLAAQCLTDLICAKTEEEAKATLTEDSHDRAGQLMEHYPDGTPEVTAEFHSSRDGYDIYYYTIRYPDLDGEETGYTLFKKVDGRYLLCVNTQVQQSVFSHYQCSTCGGSGNGTPGSQITCGICGGTGQQYIPNAYFDPGTNMWMGQYIGCSGCGGSGHTGNIPATPCPACNGIGYRF